MKPNHESATNLGDASIPIAVIGIGGRFPGDAINPECLWELIAKGRSARSEVPKDRFNIDAFYHPHAERQGTMNVRGGHFLKEDIAAFDAPFFSITAKEAHAMDPQQRLALEAAYESLENAGMRIEDIAGTQMACYMASFTMDYATLRGHDDLDVPLYEGTGNGSAMISNRISWFFDLRGPSISLDTACSSSLVALHLACHSLRYGEAKSAIVGGTNIVLMPEMQMAMTSLHFLSPEYKSQSFDHKANGYARGEGAAVIVIKPLADAIRDGNVIRAVIRGTGVNQDGKTPGITLPSAKAQEEVIRTAYFNAGLDFKDTGYFEAHGTGTAAGDPVECSAIGATVSAGRAKDNPLLVGSIKTNIGHMEGASGLVGLIKAVFSLERGLIPPNLWFEKANPRIPMEKWGIEIPTKLRTWPTIGLRRASVNSFGYGGTNAHCIVDDAYHYLRSRGLVGKHYTIADPEVSHVNGAVNDHAEESPNGNAHIEMNGDVKNGETDGISDEVPHDKTDGETNGDAHEGSSGEPNGVTNVKIKGVASGFNPPSTVPKLVFWSSHEQTGTDRAAANLVEYLEKYSDLEGEQESQFLSRLAFTLSEGRSRLPWKSYTVASTTEEIISTFKRHAPKPSRSYQVPVVGFIFTGQGAQWYAMGRELLAYPVFRESLEQADTYLKKLECPWILLDELLADEKASRINEPAISQPACTALQVALVDLLSDWKVKPSIVVGHSSGEIAAAYAKGAVTREAAWKIAYHRGRLCSTLTTDGAMLVAGLGEDAAKPLLDKLTDGTAVVACINSPSNLTFSGDTSAISQVQAMLEEQKIFNRRLLVKTAYHSPHMQALSKAYLESLEILEAPAGDADVRMFSSVTGDVVESTELGDPKYWVSNMTSHVKFAQAVQAALNYRPTKKRTARSMPFLNLLLEIGPHSALQGPLKQTLSSNENEKRRVAYISVLSRGNDAAKTILDALGKLTQQGYPADVAKANDPLDSSDSRTLLVDLPPFAWNHGTKYWYESNASKAFRHRELPRHDLVGARSEHSSDLEPSWKNYLRVEEMPWIEHHKVQGSLLYPLSGMMVMAIEAIKQIADQTKEIEGFHIRDVSVGTAMVIPAGEALETKLQFRPWRLGSRLPDSFWKEFTVSCRTQQGDWTKHCEGLISIKYKKDINPTFANEDIAEAKRHRDEYIRLSSAGFKPDDPKQVYAYLGELGLQWGPTFMSLVHIGSGDYEAHCIIDIPDTKKYMPENFESPHVIHPVTLDGFIQMVIPACTPAGVQVEKAKIPRFIESIFISQKIGTKAGERYYGYSKTKPYGFNESVGTMVASDIEWEEPLIVIEGCRIISLDNIGDGSPGQANTRSLRKLGSHPVWDKDIEHLPLEIARPFFGELGDIIRDEDPRVIKDLELASFIFCKRILSKVTVDEAAGFAPHHRLFYQYMQHRYNLAKEGKADCQGGDMSWLDTSQSFEDELLQRVSLESIDGKLLCHQGYVLEKILTGKLEPLQVLRENDLLTDYYRTALGTGKWNPIVAKYVQTLSHKKVLRILEVGAGTGGTTSVVLSALGKREEASARLQSYTFTDISGGFFEAAAEDFKEWAAFLEYKILDVEKDPLQQGMQAGMYDMVIANNVLHATASVSACLANCRTMLRPGGILLLGEITSKLARIPMIFGTLPGWWNGENDNRKLGPTMLEREWESLLTKQGFTGLDMCFRDHSMEGWHGLSLMVSTAARAAKPILPKSVIVVKPTEKDEAVESLVTSLTKLLEAEGTQVDAVAISDIQTMDLTGQTCISMLEANAPLLHHIGMKEFEVVKKLLKNSNSLLWLTNGATMESTCPEGNMIAGLGRTIRGEIPETQLTTLDLDPYSPIGSESTVAAVKQVLLSGMEATSAKRPDWEHALREGIIHTLRLHPHNEMNVMFESTAAEPLPVMLPFKQTERALALAVRVPGMLDTFQWVDDMEWAKPIGDLEVEISVKAVGMNFHDVMISMGQIADIDLGCECSGVVTRVGKDVIKYKPGDRVITFRLGCFRTFLRNPEVMFQKVPDEMSFEDAASIPCIYCTVYYAIFDIARLRKKESILIHSAAGGVGQGAIILAQHIGAETFVTVSSEVKKRFLMEKYNIPEDHIFNSRDYSFAAGIKRMTNGKGVDVVLNSLAGEGLRQTWLSVAPFGRFIELGKRDIVGNTGLDMAPFVNNVTFAGVNMLQLYRENVDMFGRIIADVMRILSEGLIRPVEPLTIMNYSKLEEAFRIMQTGKHIGKMILTAGDDDVVPVVPQKRKPYSFSPDATYIFPGGLGGLGRSIAAWMVKQGARNLVFTSRSGAARPEAQKLLGELAEQGAQVKAFTCDISNVSEFEKVLKHVKDEFPPIRGVITGAMQLQDVLFENMSIEDYHAAVRPKVQATRNLHDLLPKDLDFFVCLSSTGGIVGSRGQSNYNAGNTYQDAMAHHRRSQGLKATSINLGIVLGVGYAAEREEVLAYLKAGSLIGVREQEVLAIVQAAMADQLPAQVVIGLASGGLLKQSGHDEPYWFADSRFNPLRVYDTQDFTTAGVDSSAELQAALADAKTMAEATDAVCSAFRHKLAKAMMMEVDDVDAARPANSYGVDSLVAVEIRAWVFKEVKSDVSVFDILSNAPLVVLAGKIAAKSALVSPAIRGEEQHLD